MQPDSLAYHTAQLSPLLDSARLHVEQLVLVCGGSWQERCALLQSAAETYDLRYIALGLPLAQALLNEAPRQRPFLTTEIIENLAHDAAHGLALDQIEILFDPELHLNPLRQAQSLARRQLLLLSWPGDYDGERLSYAQPGHPEYRTFQPADTFVYVLEQSA